MAQFATVGGHVVLDLVNTGVWHVPAGDAARVDHLRSADGLLRWAAQVDLVESGTVATIDLAWHVDHPADAALRATLALREAVHEILLAALGGSTDAAADARATLHRCWSEAVHRAVLVPTADDDGAVEVTAGPDPALLIPDRLALAAVDLLRSVDLHQLKQCPLDEGGCGYLFLDRSRNGSRRWCSMRDCGTHVKAQRLTARRRAARTAASG